MHSFSSAFSSCRSEIFMKSIEWFPKISEDFFISFVLCQTLFYFNLIVICPLIISLLNYLFIILCVCLFFICFQLFNLLLIIWLDWVLMSGFWNLICQKLHQKYLDLFSVLLYFIIHFTFFCGFLNELKENIWFLCYTYNYKICLVVQLNSFVCLKIMHMAMILMLIFCLRRDFGYFVVLKISVILKEKIAFNFPSIFNWFSFIFIFHLCYFLIWFFFVYCNFGVAVFCSGSGKKKL